MVALNITLNFILMQFMAHRGLALSTSITAGVNYFILLYLIRKKMPGITFSGIIRNIAKTLLICLIIFFLLVIGRNILPVQGRIELLIRDAVFSVVAFGLFYLSAILIKIDYITQAGKALCKRFLRK